MSVLCPMDGRQFDPRTNYAGTPHRHASARRRYCSQQCLQAARRERDRVARQVRSQVRLRKVLAALEAAGQGVLLP